MGWGVGGELGMGGLVPSTCGGEQGCLPSLPATGSPNLTLTRADSSQGCAGQRLGALAAAWSPVYTNTPAAFISGGAALGYFWHKS